MRLLLAAAGFYLAAPQEYYTPCTDDEAPGMNTNGNKCDTWENLPNYCRNNNAWTNKKYCQASCWLLNLGYDGDDCSLPATSLYVLGESKASSCESGAEITTKAECENALGALAIEILSNTIKDGEACYVNGAWKGRADGNHTLWASFRFVCKKTPPPTPAPVTPPPTPAPVEIPDYALGKELKNGATETSCSVGEAITAKAECEVAFNALSIEYSSSSVKDGELCYMNKAEKGRADGKHADFASFQFVCKLAPVSTCTSDARMDHTCGSEEQCGCGGYCDTVNQYCRQVRATCGDADGTDVGTAAVSCPFGYVSKPGALSTECVASTCDTSTAGTADTNTCCQAKATCGDADGTGVDTATVSCPSGYLVKSDVLSTECDSTSCDTSSAASIDTSTCCEAKATCGDADGGGPDTAMVSCPSGYVPRSGVLSIWECEAARCDTSSSASIDTSTCCEVAGTCGDADGVGAGTAAVSCPSGYVPKSGTQSTECLSATCDTSSALAVDTNICCEARATCGDADGAGNDTAAVSCPSGYLPKPGVQSTECGFAICDTSSAGSADTSICCEVAGTCGDADGAGAGTAAVSCPSGYVSKSLSVSDECVAATCDTSSAGSRDTSICCEATATCGDADGAGAGTASVSCPWGYVLKSGVVSMNCAAATCDTSTAKSQDTSTCCEARGTCGNADGMGAGAVSCPSGFVAKSGSLSEECATTICDTSSTNSPDTRICCEVANTVGSSTVVTITQNTVVQGSAQLDVEDITGIEIGDSLTISNSGDSETKTITAVTASNGGRRLATAGTVTVDTAFEISYPAGAIVTVSQAKATCGDADGVGVGTVGVSCPSGYVSKAGVSSVKCYDTTCHTSSAGSVDTSTCCEAKATCGDANGDASGTDAVTCPSGYILQSGVSSIDCAGATCDTSTPGSADTTTCCVVKATCGDADGAGDGTTAVSCPSGYVAQPGVLSTECAAATCHTNSAGSDDTSTCCEATATCGDADGAGADTVAVTCPSGYVSKSGTVSTGCKAATCDTETAGSVDTSICCEARATCGDADGAGDYTISVICPSGYVPKSGVASVECAAGTCHTSTAGAADTSTCCEAKATCGNADGAGVGTAAVSCPAGYVLKSGVASLECAAATCDTSSAGSDDTNICCEATATCGDADGVGDGTTAVTCPSGYVAKSGVVSLGCAASTCDTRTAESVDTGKCCEAKATCGDADGKGSAAVSCPSRYVLRSGAMSVGCAAAICDTSTEEAVDTIACCEAKATCGDGKVSCPGGYVLNSEASSTLCAAATCDTSSAEATDTGTCCKAKGTELKLVFTIQNVDFAAMTNMQQAEMASGIKTTVASSTRVPENNVNVAIRAGSVAVSASITVPDQMDVATLKSRVDENETSIIATVVSQVEAIADLPTTGTISVSGFLTSVEVSTDSPASDPTVTCTTATNCFDLGLISGYQCVNGICKVVPQSQDGAMTESEESGNDPLIIIGCGLGGTVALCGGLALLAYFCRKKKGATDESHLKHGSSMNDTIQGFLSLRFGGKTAETKKRSDKLREYAAALKEELEAGGHEVFLCSVGVGDEFGPEIMKALRKMDYIVPLATLDPMYGEDNGGKYVTYQELKYAHERNIQMFPIKMYTEPEKLPFEALSTRLEEAGNHNGAGLVSMAFNPSRVYMTADEEWTKDNATKLAKKIVDDMTKKFPNGKLAAGPQPKFEPAPGSSFTAGHAGPATPAQSAEPKDVTVEMPAEQEADKKTTPGSAAPEDKADEVDV